MPEVRVLTGSGRNLCSEFSENSERRIDGVTQVPEMLENLPVLGSFDC
jgi:hypothetical protein